MSARLLRGLLNARCVVPDARVPGRCFPPVSWFFFFSAELQRSAHSAQLLCMGAGGLQRDTESRLTMQHCCSFFYRTINRRVSASGCFVSLIKTEVLVILGESSPDAQLSDDKKIFQCSVSNNVNPCLTVNVTEIDNQTSVHGTIYLQGSMLLFVFTCLK